METPGARNIGFGLLWFVGGALVTIITYGAAPGGYFVVASGAIVGGLLQFFVGLFQYLNHVSKNKVDRLIPGPELRALVRAMMAMAKSDGNVEKTELDSIRNIINSVTKNQIAWATIDEVCKELSLEKKSIPNYLADNAANFEDSIKELIIHCSVMIAAADGRITEDEFALVSTMGQSMRMQAADVLKILEGLLAPPEPVQKSAGA
ncbi:TerB family tellurite resistance protein [Mesorhizobium sp. WSM4303]|uniref:TerB family tellurite resistance protein n=1 Tax=unclassified Mesorhizobium TaxID=325217 RepID=UPI00115DC8D1|nr:MULTISPECIES: TerB family tellurite resistance protein [unclassified Mesorhizobium]TRC97164.1 TerB family tellurite resistance protein [Mesorhizobium sp. WSM4306]TRD05406.1 TerB family tellurite resistance protein [Mesorhizobium sp. WSM4303]